MSSVIDRGIGTLWYRETTHIAPAGSLVLLNPDEIHTGQVAEPQEHTRLSASLPGILVSGTDASIEPGKKLTLH